MCPQYLLVLLAYYIVYYFCLACGLTLSLLACNLLFFCFAKYALCLLLLFLLLCLVWTVSSISLSSPELITHYVLHISFVLLFSSLSSFFCKIVMYSVFSFSAFWNINVSRGKRLYYNQHWFVMGLDIDISYMPYQVLVFIL